MTALGVGEMVGKDAAAHDVLPPPLTGEQLRISASAGDIAVYAAGQGAPMLLIHSVNAAASAAEVRPLFDHFRKARRVFALDLPGFGLSSRVDLPYSPALMTDALNETVRWIRSHYRDEPVDALALSLSAEYLARSAMEMPNAYGSLALVSPTGFRGKTPWRRPPGSDRGIAWLYRALRGPGWGGAVFRQLTRPKVIRYFLERTWGSKRIDEELWRYDVLTARLPGAEFAPLRFLSGFLFSADIHTVYESLGMPVWMSHGVRGDFTDYRNKSLVADRPNWTFNTYPTGALPHFEIPDTFCLDYQRFLQYVESAAPRS